MFKFFVRTLISPYVRVGREVLKVKNDLAGGVQAFKEAKARGFRELPSQEPDIVAARAVQGGRERFDFLVHHNELTPKELARRLVITKQKQAVSLLFATLSLLLGYGSAAGIIAAPGTWAVITHATLGYLGFAATALFMIKAFKMAVFKTQLQERDLMTARDFASRPGCARKILLPFA